METRGNFGPRARRSFTSVFVVDVVALVHQPGNTAHSVGRDLGLTETAVGEWSRGPRRRVVCRRVLSTRSGLRWPGWKIRSLEGIQGGSVRVS